MRLVTLNRGAFDAFYRAYSMPAIPADETALMVSYNIRLKLNAASSLPPISDQARRDLEASGARQIRQMNGDSCELSFTEEEYQLCLARFAEGRKTFTGWMEVEVVEALIAFRDARRPEAIAPENGTAPTNRIAGVAGA